MKTILALLQLITVSAIAIISGEIMCVLVNGHGLLAVCTWIMSLPAITNYIKITDKLWLNKES